MVVKPGRLCLLLLLFSASAEAQNRLPKLELGVSLLSLSSADYRGSASDDSYLFVVPYIKYRGDRFKVDDGIQGYFPDYPNLEISVSGNATVPVKGDTAERADMAKLDAIFELGPSIDYRFHQLSQSAWWINLPWRFAYTANSRLSLVGQVFQPRLEWRKPARQIGDWKLGFNIGPVFANQEYHRYFYSVTDSEATAERPAYNAAAGLSSYRTEFSYSKRFGRYWMGGFLRHDNMHHSSIEDSPLVLEKDAWFAGIGFGWIFLQR